MIYFIEPNKQGGAHSIINGSMLEIFLQQEDVHFFGGDKHIENIKLVVKDHERVSFSVIRVIDGSAKTWIFKEVLEVYNLTCILWKANRNEVDFVFISSMFPMAHFFFRTLKWMFPGVRIIIGLHGELEFVKREKELKLRFLGWFLKRAFRTGGDLNVKYLVYGESIRANIVKGNILPEAELIVIDHPYHYKAKGKDLVTGQHIPLRFGSIGLATVNKNSHLIFALANELKDVVDNKKAEFCIIGSLLSELRPFANEYVSCSWNDKHLDRALFENGISALDYALYFYDNSFYTLSASGALFDAISFEKPILALRNDYFSFYFERLGAIGYLFNDLHEMASKIRMIVNGECRHEYEQMIANMKDAKEQMSLNNISASFWRQVDFSHK